MVSTQYHSVTSRWSAVMNLRASSASQANVEELKRQIETALGGVEEIVKNKAVISVATSPDQPVAQGKDEDDLVVYVSIKINKTEEEEELEAHHYNGTGVNGPEKGRVVLQSGAGGGKVGPGGGRVRSESGEMREVRGRAIVPGRRGVVRSMTAPSTPARTARLARTGDQARPKHTKSLEVRLSSQPTLFVFRDFKDFGRRGAG